MKHIFILYMPGHAGNFLTRLFSLSPETVPQVPISILTESIKYPEIEPILPSRVKLLSFSQVLAQHGSWQQFHREWPDFQNWDQFQYFSQLFHQPFSSIIYPIHPVEFNNKQEKINAIKEKKLYYVDLDQKYYNWVRESQTKLNFTYRPDFKSELATFENIKTKHNINNSINLTKMLDSADGFIDEYLKISSNMELTATAESALTLYHEWLGIRGPNI